jgi:hypothetical protein
MFSTLLQMFALIGLGFAWSWWNPAGLAEEVRRRALTDLVYYLFLPALVLEVLWRAPLGLESVAIAVSAAAGVLLCLGAAALVCRRCKTARPIAGAVLLAAAFPNVTYMGLPLLENTFGPWARRIAIQYDLFACTPLLLTVGILLASRYGAAGRRESPLLVLLKVPALWAAAVAVALNLGGAPLDKGLGGLLQMLAAPVVPLMLMSVGMALRQGLGQWRHLPSALPVPVLQLLVMPLVVWGLALVLGLKGDVLTAVVLEGAMPSMALGVVLCDRYGLNTGVYAAAMTSTTLLSAVTLPLWYAWVG